MFESGYKLGLQESVYCMQACQPAALIEWGNNVVTCDWPVLCVASRLPLFGTIISLHVPSASVF